MKERIWQWIRRRSKAQCAVLMGGALVVVAAVAAVSIWAVGGPGETAQVQPTPALP